jgi:predicted aminopeptidase
MRIPAAALICLPLLALSSCRTVEFYSQAVGGQMEILRKSRPIPPIIADPKTDPGLKRQLQAVERIRSYAKDHLSLPGDDSYGTYADLGREYVTWVLYAAPEFSLEPKTWWYPTLGKLDYRGFFSEQDALKVGRELKQDGYEGVVNGVDAYSTLGWFHDPVLNCFVHNPDIDLAELIFHELTHRRLFRPGDTDFNESMATAFAEEGVKRWLKSQRRFSDLRRYEELLVKREEFYQEIETTRGKLEALYASGKPAAEKRRLKAAALRDLQDRFIALRRRWGGRGLESWIETKLNNAHLVSVITYQRNTAVFRRLLAECHGDSAEFFRRAETLDLTPHMKGAFTPSE